MHGMNYDSALQMQGDFKVRNRASSDMDFTLLNLVCAKRNVDAFLNVQSSKRSIKEMLWRCFSCAFGENEKTLQAQDRV